VKVMAKRGEGWTLTRTKSIAAGQYSDRRHANEEINAQDSRAAMVLLVRVVSPGHNDDGMRVKVERWVGEVEVEGDGEVLAQWWVYICPECK
jgi:hypothetical protein